MTTVDAEILEELKETIADVRDKEIETDWVAVGHHPEKKRVLTLEGSGDDGLKGIRQLATDDKVLYCLLKDEDIFIFVQWVGPNVGALKKAQTAFERTHVRNMFGNCHVEILAEEKGDLSDEHIQEKTSYYKQTSGRVRGDSVDEGSKAKVGMKQRYIHASTRLQDSNAAAKPESSLSKETDNTIEVEDRDDVIAELGDFRESEGDYDWLVIGYKEGETTEVKTGSADGNSIQKTVQKLAIVDRVNGLLSDWDGLAEDSILYCLGSQEDGGSRRFYLVNWQGAAVSLARKAAASTHRGIISDLLRKMVPNFVEIPAETKEELRDLFSKGQKSEE